MCVLSKRNRVCCSRKSAAPHAHILSHLCSARTRRMLSHRVARRRAYFTRKSEDIAGKRQLPSPRPFRCILSHAVAGVAETATRSVAARCTALRSIVRRLPGPPVGATSLRHSSLGRGCSSTSTEVPCRLPRSADRTLIVLFDSRQAARPALRHHEPHFSAARPLRMPFTGPGLCPVCAYCAIVIAQIRNWLRMHSRSAELCFVAHKIAASESALSTTGFGVRAKNESSLLEGGATNVRAATAPRRAKTVGNVLYASNFASLRACNGVDT